jgi:hypothetical protein
MGSASLDAGAAMTGLEDFIAAIRTIGPSDDAPILRALILLEREHLSACNGHEPSPTKEGHASPPNSDYCSLGRAASLAVLEHIRSALDRPAAPTEKK